MSWWAKIIADPQFGGDLRAELARLDPVLHLRFLELRVVAFGLRRGFPWTQASCFSCSVFALGLLAFVHVRFSCRHPSQGDHQTDSSPECLRELLVGVTLW